MDAQELLPRYKNDLKRAGEAVAAGYPAVAPLLPELIEWLRDCNWPVAHTLAPFLGSVGAPIIPHVRRVLESDDNIWKYCVICTIVSGSREVAVSFKEGLQRPARFPTADEASEGLDETAQDVLDLYGWQE